MPFGISPVQHTEAQWSRSQQKWPNTVWTSTLLTLYSKHHPAVHLHTWQRSDRWTAILPRGIENTRVRKRVVARSSLETKLLHV
jgi:hypothetical protein